MTYVTAVTPLCAARGLCCKKEAAPEGAAKFSNVQCTNCWASATSTESPSWFRTSSPDRSEEHTSDLQSLMRSSYPVLRMYADAKRYSRCHSRDRCAAHSVS